MLTGAEKLFISGYAVAVRHQVLQRTFFFKELLPSKGYANTPEAKLLLYIFRQLGVRTDFC